MSERMLLSDKLQRLCLIAGLPSMFLSVFFFAVVVAISGMQGWAIVPFFASAFFTMGTAIVGMILMELGK